MLSDHAGGQRTSKHFVRHDPGQDHHPDHREFDVVVDPVDVLAGALEPLDVGRIAVLAALWPRKGTRPNLRFLRRRVSPPRTDSRIIGAPLVEKDNST